MAGEAPTVPFWQNKYQCEDAHNNYMEKLAGSTPQTIGGAVDSGVLSRLVDVEQDNKNLKKVTGDLQCLVKKLEQRLAALELSSKTGAPAKVAPPAEKEVDEDEDDFELFGSDDEEDDAAAEKLKQERLAAYAEKKSTKTAIIAKSSLLLDVKPWDDETDMKKMEELVRSISMDGLVWGASKLVPVGYGIKKLQICAVIVDDLVSTDDLEEQITAFEDYVQSMDIAAFNKI